MKARGWLAACAMVAAAHVSGLTPPSKSDGPVRLMNCVVSAAGVLEVEVENQTDDPMNCNLRCNYEIGGTTFTHWFNETLPARYSGRIGKFDTSGAKAGNYPGEVGTCKKTVARG